MAVQVCGLPSLPRSPPFPRPSLLISLGEYRSCTRPAQRESVGSKHNIAVAIAVTCIRFANDDNDLVAYASQDGTVVCRYCGADMTIYFRSLTIYLVVMRSFFIALQTLLGRVDKSGFLVAITSALFG